MASDIPSFQNLDEDKLAAIKASLGIVASEAGIETPSSSPGISTNTPSFPRHSIVSSLPRKRGRPRKQLIEDFPEPIEQHVENVVPAVPLTKRDEREVAKRLAQLLTSGTGMASIVRPYLEMTEEEANNIAEPLASYLVRNEATQVVAREILDNYDLLAIVVGVMAYVVRVYRDRSSEVEERKAKSAPRPIADRVPEYQARNFPGPEVGESNGEHAVAWPSSGISPGL